MSNDTRNETALAPVDLLWSQQRRKKSMSNPNPDNQNQQQGGQNKPGQQGGQQR